MPAAAAKHGNGAICFDEIATSPMPLAWPLHLQSFWKPLGQASCLQTSCMLGVLDHVRLSQKEKGKSHEFISSLYTTGLGFSSNGDPRSNGK